MLKVLEIALAEVGYLEKANNSNLDSKTGNAGNANFTKYARDIDRIAGFYNGKKQGFAWCDVFVDWCFIEAYGAEMAKRLLYQPNNSAGAGCYYSALYFKQAGQFFKTPKVGDQIFFGSDNDVTHTGLVYGINSQYVFTVEGNTSGVNGVVANGGAVCCKSYPLGYGKIYGYGRPNYALVDGDQKEDQKEDTQKEEIKPIIGGNVEVKLSVLSKGSKGNEVKSLQALLIKKFSISCGSYGMDGDFGNSTDKAVKEFQTNKKLEVDGIVGKETWKALLN